MNLLERMKEAGTIKTADAISRSSFFNMKDVIPTSLPILNVAFSGHLDGGLIPGLTVFAGESKCYKTLLALYCIRAYMDKYPEAICLFYDSEFGVTPAYLKANGIDSERMLHIPVEHIEQLKFDIVKRLEKINRGDKVFVYIDSLGALASKKEVDDAIDEKAVSDMTRAKAIRSLLRIITPHLTMKDLPCIVVNHVYKEIGLYPKTVIPGGTSVTYLANQIFVITRAQEKDGTELMGYNFTIHIEKSRFVREKSKLMFTVTFEHGIKQYSGMLDLALEGKFVQNPSMGWYQKPGGKKPRAVDTENAEFWNDILRNQEFKTYVQTRFNVAHGDLLGNFSPITEQVGEEAEESEVVETPEKRRTKKCRR